MTTKEFNLKIEEIMQLAGLEARCKRVQEEFGAYSLVAMMEIEKAFDNEDDKALASIVIVPTFLTYVMALIKDKK